MVIYIYKKQIIVFEISGCEAFQLFNYKHFDHKKKSQKHVVRGNSLMDCSMFELSFFLAFWDSNLQRIPETRKLQMELLDFTTSTPRVFEQV